MNFARVLIAASACVVLGAAVAACSGSFGSGSGLPQTLGTMAPGNPTPSPTPNSTSVILTVGESTAFQTIPEIAGYAAQLAFPKVAPEAKAASAKGSDKAPAAAPTPVAIAIGATLSIAKPGDGPDLNLEGGKGKKKHTREHPARALAYITLLPTHDVTFESYPRITIDVPREIASQYRDGEFGLALWNAGEKDSAYRLAVAELDKTATPPPVVVRETKATAAPSALPSASASATPSPGATTPSTIFKGGNPPGLGGNVPVAGPTGIPGAAGVIPTAGPTLPPARILFAGTEKTLKLLANRPAVFAVYALPHPAAGTPAPSPSAAAAAAAAKTTAPGPNASASPAASGSPTAAASAGAVPTKAP